MWYFRILAYIFPTPAIQQLQWWRWKKRVSRFQAVRASSLKKNVWKFSCLVKEIYCNFDTKVINKKYTEYSIPNIPNIYIHIINIILIFGLHSLTLNVKNQSMGLKKLEMYSPLWKCVPLKRKLNGKKAARASIWDRQTKQKQNTFLGLNICLFHPLKHLICFPAVFAYADLLGEVLKS